MIPAVMRRLWWWRKRSLGRPAATPWLSFLVLATSLGLTSFIAVLADHNARSEAQRSFDIAAQQVQAKIAARMEAYIALLRGGVALASAYPYALDTPEDFPAARLVRERFRQYVQRLQLPVFYPGVQGYGLTVRVDAKDIDTLIRRMRAEGHSDFRISPDSARDEYHAIVYLQPQDARNQAAIGYDMHTDPVRRQAMNTARDTAQPAMSGRVTLVQEITPRKQAGFLIYMPIYGGGVVPGTIEARRELLQGFIYSPFRADDLLHGIMGESELPLLRLAVYDGAVNDDALLYRSNDDADVGRFSAVRRLEVAGRVWLCAMNSRPAFDAHYGRGGSGVIVLGGILVSLLLFYLTMRESRALNAAARTMRKLERSRDALTESERRFQDMANAAPAMLWEADAAGGRTYFNRGWLDFRGRPLAAERGERWLEGVHADDRDRFAAQCAEAILRRSRYEIEYRLQRNDGEYRWVIDSGVPRYNAVGFYVGYTGSCIDITARKMAEEELEEHVRQRTAELEAANRELEAFSYSVSHDLRAPVRAINAFSDMVLTKHGGELSQEVGRLIDKVHRNAINMGQLIDDLLSFARVGRAKLSRRQVDMEVLAQDVAQELSANESERDIRVEVEKLPPACGDSALLRQVFFNLLSNAFKFTRPRATARIVVGATSNDPPVFFVRDNGVGFDSRYANKMFGVFERLHSAAQFEGTGVGLALVQRIIERHGGRIWADSEPDHYAVFYFHLAPEKADDHSGTC